MFLYMINRIPDDKRWYYLVGNICLWVRYILWPRPQIFSSLLMLPSAIFITRIFSCFTQWSECISSGCVYPSFIYHFEPSITKTPQKFMLDNMKCLCLYFLYNITIYHFNRKIYHVMCSIETYEAFTSDRINIAIIVRLVWRSVFDSHIILPPIIAYILLTNVIHTHSPKNMLSINYMGNYLAA